MTAAHVTVQSGQKCNEHVSVTNMAKRDTQNILLLWKCWNSASCLTFILTLGRCLRSFLLLKYTVLHSHCTVCWQVLPALLGQRRGANLKQITHFTVCVCINWATQNYELYGEAIFVRCIVCINLFLAWQQVQSLSVLHTAHWQTLTLLLHINILYRTQHNAGHNS
jgi:hypothetical protein